MSSTLFKLLVVDRGQLPTSYFTLVLILRTKLTRYFLKPVLNIMDFAGL